MFLLILGFIWQIFIMVWFAYSTVYTLRSLFVKLKEKKKE